MEKDETNHFTRCTVCHEILSSAAHTYGAWTLTTPATCVAQGIESRTCSVCSYTETRTVGTGTHEFSEAWESDAENHWHACQNCDEKADIAAHEFSEWKNVRTYDNYIKQGRICSVCKYKEYRTVPQINPQYDLTGDSIVNTDDVIFLLYHSYFPALYKIEDTSIFDFDKDNKITDKDAISLLFFIFFPDIYETK